MSATTEIHSSWTVEDVREVWDEFFDEDWQRRHPLTDELAGDVLDEVDRRFDANRGINWDVIEFHLQGVLERHYGALAGQPSAPVPLPEQAVEAAGPGPVGPSV
ncbi:MAG: hypothetical protein LBR20_06775 [Propionibacteriaceae bacterium]|nr:hypothetical protein [Propionibacteriaceae bacterium]